MSQNGQARKQICCACGKTRKKFDASIVKCIRHNYRVCAVCSRTTRGKSCPQCANETRNSVATYQYPQEEEKSQAQLSETEVKGLKKKYDDAVKELRNYKETESSLEALISEREAQMSQVQLEKYAIKEEYEKKISQLKQEQQGIKNQFQSIFKKERERIEEDVRRQYKGKLQNAQKHKDYLEKRLSTVETDMNRNHQLQIQLLKNTFESERQGMKLDLQQEREKDRQKLQDQQNEIRQAYRIQMEELKNKYQHEIRDIKKKNQQYNANLIERYTDQRRKIQEEFTIQRLKLENQIQEQKKKLVQQHQQQKVQIRGTFYGEKQSLHQVIQQRNQQFASLANRLNDEKKKLLEQIQLKTTKQRQNENVTQKKLAEYEGIIEKLKAQNEQMSKYIESHDQSLNYYQQNVSDFGGVMERCNRHLVEQFNNIDGSYSEPSPQKMKNLLLLVTQYKDVKASLHNAKMIEIFREKQSILTGYVSDEMSQCMDEIDTIRGDELLNTSVESGKKFKRIVKKIQIFRMFNNSNINDSIQIHLIPRLVAKLKQLLIEENAKLNELHNKNSYFQLLKQVENYYEFKGELKEDLEFHVELCEEEYQTIDKTLQKIYSSFTEQYNQIKLNQPASNEQQFLQKADHLRGFIRNLIQIPKYPQFRSHLEDSQIINVDDIKESIVQLLRDNRVELGNKFKELQRQRNYLQSCSYQKVFKKFKVFDEVLSKEENAYYKFNYTELLNELTRLIGLQRDQKIHLSNIFITQEKVDLQLLDKELANIQFDAHTKSRYIYKIKNVLNLRTTGLNSINNNTIITSKQLEQFVSYNEQAINLEKIASLSNLAEIGQFRDAAQKKVPVFTKYLQGQFKSIYDSSTQFKGMKDANKNARYLSNFQTFLQNNFSQQHRQFRNTIKSEKYSRLPSPQGDNEPAFTTLTRYNVQRSEAIDDMLNLPDQLLPEEYFEYYDNMMNLLSKEDGSIIQKKLRLTIMDSIGQLQAKQWVEGEMTSNYQKRLLAQLNKLPNKQIAFYRQLITIHKNKVIEQRQKIINSEKRKLRQDDFSKLKVFVNECQKHQSTNTKFSKLYINILEDYMNYSYENLGSDCDKKCVYVNNIYRLKLLQSTQTIKQIFKTREHKIYFSKPDLFAVKSSIDVIERFEGYNEGSINKVVDELVNTFKLASTFNKNQENSLLDEEEKENYLREIEILKNDIMQNYLTLCRELKYENIFDEKFQRRKMLVDLIKIETYINLMKRFQQYTPHIEYYIKIEEYSKIVKKINNRIEKAFEQVKQFRFYKDELKMQYDNNHFLLGHLNKIQKLAQTFRDHRYQLYKFQDYLKNNYLKEIHFQQVNYKQVIRYVEMAWIKQYTNIKREINEMFTHQRHLDVILKYKMILHEKEIVKSENLLCFNEMIKEEYDFKRIVIGKLKEEEERIEGHLHHLEREYQSFSENIRSIQSRKKEYLQVEKLKIKVKYQKLMEEVKNSFHEEKSQELRQNKIDAQVNTLMNQLRTEEQNMVNQQLKKIQNFRNKFSFKTDNIFTKLFDHLSLVKKIEAIFDLQIEQICKNIMIKVQREINRYDKQLKNEFINHVKKSKNADVLLGISELNIFKQVNEQQFRLNTKAMNNINEVINRCPQMKDREADKKQFIRTYDEYQTELQRVQKEYSETLSENNVIQLIKDTKARVKELSPQVVIARIFAIYAICRHIDSGQDELTFDGNPHVAQVVAILLLIDAHRGRKKTFDNRLIEVKTGEGKSRVLAGLNCFLALHGYDVYCGCYSSYLSQRDEEQFHSLFVRFGVHEMITYGPFSEHCQSVFNEGKKFNFKQIAKKVLLNEKLASQQLGYLDRLNKLLKRQARVNRILVIDEVDVFFDEQYFGKLYSPAIVIDGPEVKRLIELIWKNRSEQKLKSIVLGSSQFGQICTVYPHLKDFITNQVHSMVFAANNYSSHPYQIRNNEIQYLDNGAVNKKLNFGYSTTFASCYEYERGKISEENYYKNINISLIIGQFSYAELPKYFDNILGVSGTVQAMSGFQKTILKDSYQIRDDHIYTLPSIYGESHRKVVGFRSVKPDVYIAELIQTIKMVRQSERPILVFFQNEEEMNKISTAPQFIQFTSNIYKITEKMPPEMRNPLINYAGTKNRITLISAAFSRGTDFTVFDAQINEKGGMHVIQTYISKTQSDLIQIMGRTARQGKNGSFQMLISSDQLALNGIDSAEGKNLEKAIQDNWEVYNDKHGDELSKSISFANTLHQTTFNVVSTLSMDSYKLIETVTKLNHVEIKNQTVHNIIAIDGTGSMGKALKAVLNILKETIERTEKIINEKRPGSSFQHKIMIYRNYNSKPIEKILQQSHFSKDPSYLESFMTAVKPEGGLGNEGHQILFYEIGKLCQEENIDQVIIIGDAPANKYEQMVKHRKKFHGEQKWEAIYPLLPSIQSYSEVVRQKKIPFHSFYILRHKPQPEHVNWDRSVEQYFKALSLKSNGECQQLQIQKKKKSEDDLTDFISGKVLQLIGGKQLAEQYKKLYGKRYV